MSDKTDKVFLDHHPVWAWHPERAEHEAGYTLFRKTVSCSANTMYRLAVSADNRFSFYLDGRLLGRGPLRGDLSHYFYDEYEGELSAGEHVFAAEVVVWSEHGVGVQLLGGRCTLEAGSWSQDMSERSGWN